MTAESTPKCDVQYCQEYAEAIVSWDGGTAYRCGIHVEEWPGDVEWLTV